MLDYTNSTLRKPKRQVFRHEREVRGIGFEKRWFSSIFLV